MKKFLLFVFAAVFISTSSYASHHESGNEDSFYDDYHDGYGKKKMRLDRREDRHIDGQKRFQLRKGRAGKERKYSNRQLHKQKMHHLKRKLNKLPENKRDAALRELERHHQEMKNIIGDDKRFPEFRSSKAGEGHVKKAVKRAAPKANNVKKVKPKVGTGNESGGLGKKGDETLPKAEKESNNSGVKWRYPKKMV